MRREAAVEAHGQEGPAALDGLGELARVGHRHGHRLLDEHRLARLDRRAGDRVVEVVAGGHVDDGHRGVVEDLAVVRRAPGEAVVLDGGADREPAAGAGRGQREAGVRLQQRQQHRAEVPAVADDPDAERAVPRRRRGAADRAVRDRARRRGRRIQVVVEQDADRPVLRGERGVRLARVLDRVRRVDERLHAERPRRDQAQHLLEVAALGPAHVAERVVVALLLVGRVVAAGAVRGRDQEVDLLLVDLVALDADRDVADQHDPALPPARLEGLVEEPRVAPGGGHDHRVRPAALRPLEDAGHEVALGDGEALIEAQGLGARHAIGAHVDADDDGARRVQHLRGDLAQQARGRGRPPGRPAPARPGARPAARSPRGSRRPPPRTRRRPGSGPPGSAARRSRRRGWRSRPPRRPRGRRRGCRRRPRRRPPRPRRTSSRSASRSRPASSRARRCS